MSCSYTEYRYSISNLDLNYSVMTKEHSWLGSPPHHGNPHFTLHCFSSHTASQLQNTALVLPFAICHPEVNDFISKLSHMFILRNWCNVVSINIYEVYCITCFIRGTVEFMDVHFCHVKCTIIQEDTSDRGGRLGKSCMCKHTAAKGVEGHS